MDPDEVLNVIGSFLRQNVLAVSLLCIGIISLIIGVFVVSSSQTNETIQFQPAQSEARTVSPSEKNQLFVDLEGAVLRPGVYTVPNGARVQDALIKAGGFAETADRKQIAQNINLAAPLTDGAKIYFPFMGEAVVLGTGTTAQSDSIGLININTASAEALDTLPGIGTVTAQKIIQNRPYQNINELISKKSVGSKVFSQIESQITAP